MMKSYYYNILLVATFFVMSAMIIRDDGNRKEKITLQILSESLQNGHYEALAFDDNFSKKVYKSFLDHLDYGKRFFMLSDINKFNSYETNIDDQIKVGSYEFFNQCVDTLNVRVKATERYFKEVLSAPFDYTVDETVQFDPKKVNWSKDTVELKDYWRKSLKYQTMIKLADLLQIQEDAIERKDTAYKQKTYQELEIEARKRTMDTYKEWIHRMYQLNKVDRLSEFYNSITASYDPHTEYFAPKEKANFDIRMSGKLEGIGATLQESNGYIKVAQIVPGSASWKQGDLKVGDLILKVAQGANEPLSIVDMRVDDAVQYIRGKKGTEVRLTVKKIDGTIKVITIIRDEVILEETFAKSAIIEDKDKTVRVGYIYLPNFYVDFENKNGRHCSEDVAKEVEKLKKDNITSLVIDLRNNGGGSLQDVVDMAGLFIKSGPIVQVKSRMGAPYVLSDVDSRIQYDGPLAIMVGEGSASASEILAAAIQDYGRGIIVGSKTSFGKGTVQRLFDFDQFVAANYNDVKPLGSIKMTVQKFYRINGGATQLKGVSSDIVLPDNYSYMDVGEKEQDNALKWDEIQPVTFQKWNSAYDLDNLKKKSEKRVKNSEDFQLVDKNAQRMKKRSENTVYTLNLKKYREEEKARKEEAKRFDNIEKDETDLETSPDLSIKKKDNKKESDLFISPLTLDIKEMQNDTIKTAKSKAWLKDLKKDIYINEVVNIFKDMQK